MKTNIKNIALFIAFTGLLTSCSSDDAPSGDSLNGTFGDVELFFDNGVNGDALVLGSAYTNSNGETLTINRFNYIVSNIVLVKDDGTEFTYPKTTVISSLAKKLAHLQRI